MMAMRYLSLIILVALPACTQVVEGAKTVAASGTVAADSTRSKVEELLTYRAPKPPAVPPVPPTYCYRVMQDIVCYKEPKKDARGRLVAFQASQMEGGTPAPLLAEVPPPVMEVKTTVGEASPGMKMPEGSSTSAPVPLMSKPPEKTADAEKVVPEKEEAAQKAKTEKSIQKFANTKPLFVGEGPVVKETSATAPQP